MYCSNYNFGYNRSFNWSVILYRIYNFSNYFTPLIFAATFAGVSLILIFIAAVFAIKKETRQCICENGNCVVLGSVGTLIIAITALAYIESLVAASILPAILVGTLGFFVSLTFLSFIALTLCLIKSNCYKKYEHCHYDE